MSDTAQDEKSNREHIELAERVEETHDAVVKAESHSDNVPVILGWRSWLVVALTFFV
jgi:hypothetical protein